MFKAAAHSSEKSATVTLVVFLPRYSRDQDGVMILMLMLRARPSGLRCNESERRSQWETRAIRDSRTATTTT